MATEDSATGILGAVTSAAQSATSVVSSALEAMHITAAHDGDAAGESTDTKNDGEETEQANKDEADLEEGEIRETNGQAKDGPKTVFDDPVAFTLKVCVRRMHGDVGWRLFSKRKLRLYLSSLHLVISQHPLATPWTLYYGSPNVKGLPKKESSETVEKAASWMEDIRKIITFESVEEFWGLYNNVIPPSGLEKKADYYLMRDAVLPAWEDPVNKHGGKWSVQFPRDRTRERIDQMWLYTVLAAIGETFETDAGDQKDLSAPLDQSDMITGVILNARPNFYRLNIWTREAPEDPSVPSAPRERILKIGRHFKLEVLGVPLEAKLAGGPGGFSTDVEFQSHKEGSKKSKDPNKKIVL
ncbi:hypothetical protein QFC19_002991 [Naganishia cerealis]|uniref:Uncharacterized protein n=1 Tax=Naganishia cerealis TaxID=610337 RepID=A0ACC2W8D4_9TREE|nr:hypothetical protein QFC19_002991 [Naganishia cerealis]